MLDLCKWPDLPDRYDRALRECVAFILERFDAIGIVACGTIIAGKLDASSDLDMYVIHREPFRQRIQKFFSGVPAEIFVNPPASIERYFEEERAAMRPITAHMLATGYVVLDRNPVVGELRRRAEELLSEPPSNSDKLQLGRYAPKRLDAARYLPATIHEDAVDVADRDPSTAHMLLGWAVLDMLRFCFTKAGRYQPRPKDLLAALEEFDVETAALAREFYAAKDLRTRLDLAGRIADRTIGVRGFFEWESDPEPV